MAVLFAGQVLFLSLDNSVKAVLGMLRYSDDYLSVVVACKNSSF